MWPFALLVMLTWSVPFDVRDVVFTRDDGALVTVDPETATIRDVTDAAASDVVAASPLRLWTVEPSDEGGRLTLRRREPHGFSIERALPFDAAEGRVIEPSDSPVVLALAEGATLARHTPSGAFGLAWPLPASVIAHGGHLVTLDAVVDQPLMRWLTVGPTTLAKGPTSMPTTAPGARLVWLSGELATVAVEKGTPTARIGATVFVASKVDAASTVEDAIAIGPSTVAALIGPSPRLVVLGDAPFEANLPAPALTQTPWPTHRLAYDEGRNRIWVATDHAAFLVTVGPSMRVLPLPVNATSVTLLRSRSHHGTSAP